MKICMVFFDMQELGGLEEYATSLAVALQEGGDEVSVLSTAWVHPDNQYLKRLRANKVAYVELPRWLSTAASDWPTKERILARALWLCTPLIYLAALGAMLFMRRSWRQAYTSAHGWIRGQLSPLIKPDWRRPLVRQLLRWWRFRWQPELLHIQGYTSSLLFVVDWAHDHDMPIVYEEHQTPVAEFNWWQDFPATINKADRVVAVSETSAEGLRKVCGVTRPIVVRNPLLADPRASGWQEDGRERRQGEAIVVTTVARLSIAKGLDYLLQSIVQVRDVYPNTIFRVHGNGQLREELLDHAESLGLDGHEIFVGAFRHTDLSTIMQQTDLFVLSSILEGQPLALIEAMAFGCPIVTTDVGGIPELITDGMNGLLCPPASPACLANKICSLIEDPVLRSRLGHAARESYEQGPYQPSALSRHFSSVYRDVLHPAAHSV